MSKARQLADLGNVFDDGALSNRNILINGKFEVNQYNDGSSTSFAAGAYFVADRFDYYTNAGAFAVYSATHEISSDAPDGFSKSLKITCTSGGTIPSTGEVVFRQKIEGYNSSVLNYGSANGESATVSFWIKASVTGDYGLQFVYYDGTNSQFYVSKYTVNSANTWEYKTVTIPPQTTNAFDNVTNGNGLTVYWDLGEGSTYSGTAGAGWGTTYLNGLSGGVKLMENTGATWQITGVQLEVGDTATPFEHRPYSDELQRCFRYYEQWDCVDGENIHLGTSYNGQPVTAIKYVVRKRASPTITLPTAGQTSGTISFLNGTGGYPTTTGTHSTSQVNNRGARIASSGYSGITSAQPAMLYTNGSTIFKFDAEL